MKVTLAMSDVIKLLNGQKVYFEHEMDPTVCVELVKEDTSITKKGAIERIEGEWHFVLDNECGAV